MSKIKALIGAALVVPLFALGSASGSQPTGALAALTQGGEPTQVVDGGTNWECCFVYFGGRWYCIPC
jgi:hypothetical protein